MSSVSSNGAHAVPFRIPDGAPVNSRVRLARLAANLSPDQVAAALGLSARSYYRLEKGDRRPFRRGELVVIAIITRQDPAIFGVDITAD